MQNVPVEENAENSPLYFLLPYPHNVHHRQVSPFYPLMNVHPLFTSEVKKNVAGVAEADYYNQWIMENVG